MLDEIEEYNSYIKLEEANAFKGEFRGIRSILIVIARHAYFEEQIKEISEIKKILAEYCEDKKIPSEKIMAWNNGTIFNVSKNSKHKEKNSVHTISFDGIIAEAIYLGKLKKRYIMFKKKADKTNIKWNGGAIDDSDPKAWKKWQKTWNRLLKIISLYLISKSYSEQIENNIDFEELARYLNLKSFEYKKNMEGFTYTYKDADCRLQEKKIFEIKNVSGIVKIIPNQQFMKDFDFKLKELSEGEKKDLCDGDYEYYDGNGIKIA